MRNGIEIPALAERRIELFTTGFRGCVECFNRGRPFTGPSVHFYAKTLERAREIGLYRMRDDSRFAELAYATLTAWGMHRMGPVVTKLPDFGTFRRAVQQLVPKLDALPSSILGLANDPTQLAAVTDRLARLAADPTLMREVPACREREANAFHRPRLGSTDRPSYTLRFFFNSIRVNGPTERVFAVVYTG